MDDLEKRIADKAAPKVTHDSINDNIVEVTYARPFANTPQFTLCGIKMKNGFLVTGESAPVSAANFDQKIGEELAYKAAFSKLWALEGYVLATELTRLPVAKSPNNKTQQPE